MQPSTFSEVAGVWRPQPHQGIVMGECRQGDDNLIKRRCSTQQRVLKDRVRRMLASRAVRTGRHC